MLCHLVPPQASLDSHPLTPSILAHLILHPQFHITFNCYFHRSIRTDSSLIYASIIASSAAMSNGGESVILPSNPVFLVHKVGSSKAGRETQWETRTKSMRAAPCPAPRISVATSANNSVKAKGDAADGASWEFVTYSPRKGQQLPKRPKELRRKRRTEGAAASQKDRSIVSVKQQEPKIPRSPSLIAPDLPVALVGHALLYINFCMLPSTSYYAT